MNGCPKALLSPSATVRASRSAAPPGANVLTIRTGRVGHGGVWAAAGSERHAAMARSAARRFMLSSAFFVARMQFGTAAPALRFAA
jgi:hypothetical protein